MKNARFIPYIIISLILLIGGQFVYKKYQSFVHQNEILKQVIGRLEAESRVAEVLVTGVNFDEVQQESFTTIKFLEYNTYGKPLKPKYFTFSGNIIQFQSLVIRFDDELVRQGDKLKGKSAFIFWKIFMLDGKETQEYNLAEINTIPEGYKVVGLQDSYEQELWKEFWRIALDEDRRKDNDIKNVQIEAPGTMFVPGVLYTIKIEHDGGLRIDSSQLSPILRGEKIL